MLFCSRPSPSVIPSFLEARLVNLKSHKTCSVKFGTSQISRHNRLYGYQRLLQSLRQPSNYRYIHPRGPTKPLPVPEGKFHVLFFGGDEFSCYTLRKLHEAKDIWQSLEVVTQEDRQLTQHGRRSVETPVKVLAKELGLSYHLMPNKKEDTKEMKFSPPFDKENHEPNRLLVVSSLGRYIPWKILKPFPPSRRLNVHPSLIPKYRGAAPIQWTIADGLKETGVSIIEVEKVGLGYDVGDIWAQKKISVPEGSTYTFLMPLLANEGSDLLVQVLRNMINETQPSSIEQDSSLATEAPAIDGRSAIVNWWEWDASKIERLARAIVHQKPIYTYAFDTQTTLQLFDISILPSSTCSSLITSPGTATLNKRTGCLEIRCIDGSVVAVGRIKQRNRNLIPAKEWWIGVAEKNRPGGVVTFHMGPYGEDSTSPGQEEAKKDK